MHVAHRIPAGGSRDFLAVTTAQFAMAFALNFMFVFLPFYIRTISDLDETATLRWTGLILGAAAATATFGSAFWGSLSDRFSAKALFERGLISHTIIVTAMAFTSDLRLLFAIRLVQGFLGGISTIGLIIVSATSNEEQRPRRMGTFQSALTLGQIFGPPVGGLGAEWLGFRASFLASAVMLVCVCVFAHLALSRIPPQPRRESGEPIPRRCLVLAWAISLVATMHIVFLPSILPEILRDFGVPEASRLVSAGGIVFAYGVASAAGSYGFSRFAGRMSPSRLVLIAAAGASVCQILLAAAPGLVTFTLIRMLQTACAAGVFPLVLAQVAASGHGRTIGFVNTARFAGMALGPVAATFILAQSGLLTLYAVLGLALAGAAALNHWGSAQAGRLDGA